MRNAARPESQTVEIPCLTMAQLVSPAPSVDGYQMPQRLPSRRAEMARTAVEMPCFVG